MRHLFLYLFTLLILLSGCAKVMAPVGGDKDTTPPKIALEQPANQSVNFQSNKIMISFDEFFTLNNPTENILVSPPFAHPAVYEIKGKTLIIKIKDTLRENTTYNMVFSNCIKDFNEGNPLNLYHYSFSTGSQIDTCILRGSVTHAQTQSKGEDYFVMLYRNFEDSMPITTLPDYITRTTKGGNFTFQNIAAGNYKIFALKDLNGNYLYDLPNESFAFFDQPVRAYFTPSTDSISHSEDTLQPSIELCSFEVQDSFPKLQRYENPAAGIYRFPYSTAVSNFEINTLKGDIDFFQTWNRDRDTLTWYLKSLQFDTLQYIFTADGHQDTVLLKPFKAKNSDSRRGSSPKANEWLYAHFRNEGNPYHPLTIHFDYPILPTDTFNAILASKNDIISIPLVVPDTFLMDFPILLNLETKKSYQLTIPDSIFVGYNQQSNDTLRSSFVFKSEKEYGNIIIHYLLEDIDYPVITQLIEGNTILQENTIYESTTLQYAHLEPRKLHIRIIHDINGNGRWDTGNYHQKQQPEYIEKIDKEIVVRAFWDIEETFKIGSRK